MKKALVEPSGRVAQIVEAGAEFLVNPALRWVECPDGTQTEDTWDGAAFQARPVVSQIADPNLPLIAALAEIADAAGVRTPGSGPGAGSVSTSTWRLRSSCALGRASTTENG